GASREVRRFIKDWMTEKPERTLLLTTHYMAEADELCDRVAIINAGKVLACDTPANLKKGLQNDAIFHLNVSPLQNGAPAAFQALPGVRKALHTAQDGHSALELVLASDDALGRVMATLTSHQAHIHNLAQREPTLEDVFRDLV